MPHRPSYFERIAGGERRREGMLRRRGCYSGRPRRHRADDRSGHQNSLWRAPRRPCRRRAGDRARRSSHRGRFRFRDRFPVRDRCRPSESHPPLAEIPLAPGEGVPPRAAVPVTQPVALAPAPHRRRIGATSRATATAPRQSPGRAIARRDHGIAGSRRRTGASESDTLAPVHARRRRPSRAMPRRASAALLSPEPVPRGSARRCDHAVRRPLDPARRRAAGASPTDAARLKPRPQLSVRVTAGCPGP